MITFTVWKSGHQYKGFECAGHAGYAEEGSDIICAAVSALAVNTINAIEQFTEDPFEVEEAEDGGLLRIRFSEVPDEKTQLLMDSLVLGIGNIRLNMEMNILPYYLRRCNYVKDEPSAFRS